MVKQFNIKELCADFRVTPPTLYSRLINTGKLKTFKIGKNRFATDKAVEECRALLEKEAAS